MRVHRNALVAIAHIDGLERDADGHQQVRLRGGATLAVSRRLATDVAKALVARPSTIAGMTRQVRIATRKSRLARWQAEHVAARLVARHPGLEVSLVPIVTEGDRIQDRSLAAAGGKGLFIKELETALQDGRADIAVHSMKDMPAATAGRLHDRRRARARRCARCVRLAAPRIAGCPA